ncbi:MAG: hypothetical protein V3U87_03020 [Methylococcaceae bacterium]
MSHSTIEITCSECKTKFKAVLDRLNIVNKSHTTKVVGVTFDNEDGVNRQQILTQLYSGSNIKLVKDIDNSFDKYAIKVITEFGCIGYLSREEAFRFSQKYILLGECFIASLKQVDNGNIGCLINFKYQESNAKSKINNRSNSPLSDNDYSDDNCYYETLNNIKEKFEARISSYSSGPKSKTKSILKARVKSLKIGLEECGTGDDFASVAMDVEEEIANMNYDLTDEHKYPKGEVKKTLKSLNKLLAICESNYYE